MHHAFVDRPTINSRFLTAVAFWCATIAGCAKTNDEPRKYAERLQAEWAKVEKLPLKDRSTLAEIEKELGRPASIFSKTTYAKPVYSWFPFKTTDDTGRIDSETMLKASFDDKDRVQYFSRVKPDVQADYRIKSAKVDSGLYEQGAWQK